MLSGHCWLLLCYASHNVDHYPYGSQHLLFVSRKQAPSTPGDLALCLRLPGSLLRVEKEEPGHVAAASYKGQGLARGRLYERAKSSFWQSRMHV
jgi:hypothetical protein